MSAICNWLFAFITVIKMMQSPADLSLTTNSASTVALGSSPHSQTPNPISAAFNIPQTHPIVSHNTARLYAAAFGAQQPQTQTGTVNTATVNGRCYSPPSYTRRHAAMVNATPANLFSNFDDSFFQQARAEAALVAGMAGDMKPSAAGTTAMLRPAEMFYAPPTAFPPPPHAEFGMHFGTDSTTNQPSHAGLFASERPPTGGHVTPSTGVTVGSDTMSMINHPSFAAQYQVASVASVPVTVMSTAINGGGSNNSPNNVSNGGGPSPNNVGTVRYSTGAQVAQAAAAAVVIGAGEPETDPRELERFAEHFKQRRIKLGVTQADVGKALAHLKMPGVGSLSQSTICRFESLTLSHNNMVALKPILHSWLEKAEEASKLKMSGLPIEGMLPDANGILPNMEKKRKRTSIAAPEKRSLEAYFALQPRPSGEKIAAIADKLDLKKNVVRVWFCNQRQKQKRWAERHHQLRSL